MSVNTAHAENGVLIHAGEYILITIKSVTMEFSGQDNPLFKGSKTGSMYLTSHRVIFNSAKADNQMRSFSAPFIAMSDVEIEQPVFGANYIKGKVRAQPNGNFVGEVKFKIYFKSGGAIEFGQAMLRAASVMQSNMRNSNMPDNPPPYTPASSWHPAPPPAYEPPPGYYGWLPQHDSFNNGTPSVFVSDNPPPYPGIGGPPPYSGPPQQQPYGGGQQPYGGGQPAYGGGQPAYGGGQPPYGAPQDPYAGGQPPYGGGQPPYGGGQPPYGGGQPPYGGGQPPYGGGQPAYGAGGQQPFQPPTQLYPTPPQPDFQPHQPFASAPSLAPNPNAPAGGSPAAPPSAAPAQQRASEPETVEWNGFSLPPDEPEEQQQRQASSQQSAVPSAGGPPYPGGAPYPPAGGAPYPPAGGPPYPTGQPPAYGAPGFTAPGAIGFVAPPYSKEAEALASAYSTPYNQHRSGAPYNNNSSAGSSQRPPAYEDLPPPNYDAARKNQ